MPDYGLRIKNSGGNIQIDSLYRNYVLEKSGSLDINGLHSISIANNPNPPIAAVRPTGGTDRVCGVFDVSYSSPNYTAVRFFGGKGGVGQSGSCPFDYKIYTLLEGKSAEAYGLRVYDNAEKLVYDSGYIPFKILEVGSAVIGTTYNHPSHTNPYYIFSPWHSGIVGIYIPNQGPVFSLKSGIAKQSPTSVQGMWTTCAQLGVTNMSFADYSGTTFTIILCE